MTRCCRCGVKIIYPDEECESGLYSDEQYLLCKRDWDLENKLVEEAGSNDLPMLLATYHQVN